MSGPVRDDCPRCGKNYVIAAGHTLGNGQRICPDCWVLQQQIDADWAQEEARRRVLERQGRNTRP